MERTKQKPRHLWVQSARPAHVKHLGSASPTPLSGAQQVTEVVYKKETGRTGEVAHKYKGKAMLVVIKVAGKGDLTLQILHRMLQVEVEQGWR